MTTPLTDGRHSADSYQTILWNDSDGNLLTIHPDTADDSDRPTVTLQVNDVISESYIHIARPEVPRLAADLCAAAGFRELSELLLTLTSGTDSAVRNVHVTVTNADEYTANRAALSLVDWVNAEFPGHTVATDAREWDHTDAAAASGGDR